MTEKSREDKIWQRVVKIAQIDGHITPEESNLIKTILEDARNYEKVLDRAMDDGELDHEEKMELIDQRAQILDNAYREASDDQKITDDEYAIIEEVLKILHTLELEEEKSFVDEL